MAIETFPALVDEMQTIGNRVFNFDGGEVTLEARNDVSMRRLYGDYRELSFKVPTPMGRFIKLEPLVTADYLTIRSLGREKSTGDFDAVNGAANHVVVRVHHLTGSDGYHLSSPMFTENDLDITDGKGDKKFRQFDREDPFMQLLIQLLTAAQDPVDAQRHIIAAVKKLGIGL